MRQPAWSTGDDLACAPTLSKGKRGGSEAGMLPRWTVRALAGNQICTFLWTSVPCILSMFGKISTFNFILIQR
jgi:hypothetical protein